MAILSFPTEPILIILICFSFLIKQHVIIIKFEKGPYNLILKQAGIDLKDQE
jgi:hypothetical protein